MPQAGKAPSKDTSYTASASLNCGSGSHNSARPIPDMPNPAGGIEYPPPQESLATPPNSRIHSREVTPSHYLSSLQECTYIPATSSSSDPAAALRFVHVTVSPSGEIIIPPDFMRLSFERNSAPKTFSNSGEAMASKSSQTMAPPLLRSPRGCTSAPGMSSRSALAMAPRAGQALPSPALHKITVLNYPPGSLRFAQFGVGVGQKKPITHKEDSVGTTVPAPLPPSVEDAYRRKCIELRRRLTEVEEFNDAARLRIQRSKRQMMKMRLERAFLLEQLEKRTSANVEDSDGSPSPPPTPKEKPLRSKRNHRKDITQSSLGVDESTLSPFGGQGPAGGTPLAMAQGSPTPLNAFYLNAPASSPPASLTSTTTSRKQRANGKSSVAKDGGPKRPANAYMIFCEQERDTVREKLAAQHKANANNPAADGDDPDGAKPEGSKGDYEMHKMLAQAWRELGSEGQKPWFEKYEERVDGYRRRLEEWQANGGGKEAAAMGLIGLSNSKGTETPPTGGVVMERGDSTMDDVEMLDGDEDSVAAGEGGQGGFTAVNG